MNRPTAPISTASSLIQQALQEDSNRVMDWLWYAEQVTSLSEKQYCLARALYIDPTNSQAARQIKALAAEQKPNPQKSQVAITNPISRLMYGLMRRA